jgi:hypothetical protein
VGAYLLAGIITIAIRSKSGKEIESVRKILEEKAMALTPPATEPPPATGEVAIA